MRMRPVVRLLVASLFCLPALVYVAPTHVRAQDDAVNVPMEARLATLAGDFKKATELLVNAPDEVRNDAKLRRQLGDQAMGWVRKNQGVVARPGLIAAREHYEAAFTAKADDMDSVNGALEASRQLGDLEIELKQTDAAAAHAAWAIAFGEKVIAAGVEDADVQIAIARAYALRAKTASPGSHLDQILIDYHRGGELLADAAEGRQDERALLIEAAKLFIQEADVVLEKLPEGDPRAPDAMKLALEAVGEACEAKGADGTEFAAHLATLRKAKQVGLRPLPRPYMHKVKPDPIEKIEISTPRSPAWKVGKSQDWDINWDRHFEGEPGGNTVQIMMIAKGYTDVYAGRKFADVEDIARLYYENKKENDFAEITLDTGFVMLGGKGKGKKKEPEVFHYQLGGKLKEGGRRQLISEWFWTVSAKDKLTYRIRILDWGTPWSTDEPDVAAFIGSAIGEGLWPPGIEFDDETAEDKNKKKPKKKKK